MENLLPSLFSAVLLIISTIVMVMTSLNATNVMAESIKSIEQQMESARATAIAATVFDAREAVVRIMITNNGQTDLNDYDGWNVLLEAPNGATCNLTFAGNTTSPGDNTWGVVGINMANGNPEVFDPGILNPGETMIAAVNCISVFAPGQVARLTFATSNGVTTECQVAWPRPEER